MLKKRFTPKLELKADYSDSSGNLYTVMKLDSLLKLLGEYREQVKPIIDSDDKLIHLTVEALIKFYCWNKDFLETGLKYLPQENDLCTVEEMNAREILIGYIIKSMQDVDQFHPELRMLCANVSSASIIRVNKPLILLSINVANGNLH